MVIVLQVYVVLRTLSVQGCVNALCILTEFVCIVVDSSCSRLRACVSAGVLSLPTWGGERMHSLDSFHCVSTPTYVAYLAQVK